MGKIMRPGQPYHWSFSRHLLLAAGAALVLLLAGATLRAEEGAGSVKDVKGDAFAEASAARRALAPAAAIFVGDHVGTGPASRLTMLLGHDTTIRLGERGSVVIDRFLMNAGGEITLQSGPFMFERPAASPPLPVQIRSSYGLIAVRGTRLFAGPDGDALGIFVERGEVSVSAAGRRVTLRSGEGTTIPRPGARPGPVKRWPEKRIADLFSSIR
jgi:ferric-dicitrate binding protein FerR (iron transport regulator)